MSTNNKSIQILRGTTTSGGESNVDRTVLETGQPFYDKRTNTLRIGRGNETINNTAPITVDDGAITTSKLHTSAVTTDKLHDASNDESNRTGITTGKIEDNAITTPKLHDNAITPAKIDPKGNYTLNYLIIKKDGEDTGIIDVEHHLGVINNNVIAQYYADRIEAQAAILNYPNLKGDTDTIAVLSNIPKFQSIDGNLYITT